MNTVAVVQARVGSQRLPGKTLAKIEGEPMIVRVLRRLQECETIDEIVLATGPGRANAPLRDLAEIEGIDAPEVYRAENDVLGRYKDVAEEYDADVVVRITGDCPLIDPDLVDKVVCALGCGDFATNVLRRTYPKGLDCEVMPFRTLAWLDENVRDPELREHVTLYMYRHREDFVIQSVEDVEDHHELQWSVDYEEDLERIRRIYRWMNGALVGWRDILRHEEEDGRNGRQDDL